MPDIRKRRYRVQKATAIQRGIDWQFSFHEWCAVWDASGRWNERGRGKGKYVMARRGDVGPYSVANVSIQLCEQNARDARLNHPGQQLRVGQERVGSGRGWTFAANGYQAQLKGKYLGRFKTAAEAEATYRAAVQLAR